MTMIVDDKQMEAALQFLARSDDDYAQKKANMVRAERRLKSTLAILRKASNQKTQGAKDDEAYASEEYHNACQDEMQAILEFEALKAKRASAELRVEVWRSLNASRRRA